MRIKESGLSGKSKMSGFLKKQLNIKLKEEIDLTPMTDQERAEFFKVIVSIETSPSYFKSKEDEKVEHL